MHMHMHNACGQSRLIKSLRNTHVLPKQHIPSACFCAAVAGMDAPIAHSEWHGWMASPR